jgi:hypothetical protein
MAAHEQALAEVQERVETLEHEARTTRDHAVRESEAMVSAARIESDTMLTSAREQAEKIRRDSERELAAATARRDSITAQLSNVRQMLSTLGGTSLGEVLSQEPVAEAAPAADEGGPFDQDAAGEPAAEAKAKS